MSIPEWLDNTSDVGAFWQEYEKAVVEKGIVNTIELLRSSLGAEVVSDLYQKRERKDNNKRTIKSIASFFFRMSDGGTEKVIQKLNYMFEQKGYSPYLITDAPSSEELPDDNVEHFVIGEPSDCFALRMQNFASIIESKSIDILIYHAWMSEQLIWDILLAHHYNVKVILYSHGVFTSNYYFYTPAQRYIHKIYRCCDLILTLADINRDYFETLGCNTLVISNPRDKAVLAKKSDDCFTNKIIIWVGRFSVEKRPIDALRIFKEVRKQTKCKLVMLGEGSEEAKQEISLFLKMNRLENDVELPGYVNNPYDYYQQATIYLSTSSVEGFQYSLYESQEMGIPCVMYELPYLPIVQNNGACVQVKQGAIQEAASEILRLMGSRERYEELSSQAKLRACRLYENSVEKQWDNIFNQLEEQNNHTSYSFSYLDLLIEHMAKYVEGEKQEIYNSREYQIGYRIKRIRQMLIPLHRSNGRIVIGWKR